MICRICGSDKVKETVVGKEMMIPTYEEFRYFECDHCHCLQIEEIPADLGRYYGPDYYSFQNSNPDESEDSDSNSELSGSKDMTPILDVGCGAGKFLKQLQKIGYGNLTGCDPFLEQDLVFGENIHIYKKTIHEMSGKFDKIFMCDSFEHVTDPHEVMESAKRLLSTNGILRIAIPVYPNIAFEMFEGNWYQLDAPRHIFLHSVKSMEILAAEHGLKILKVDYDADPSQIFRSYLYSKGVPFWEQKMSMVMEDLGEDEVNEIEQLSKEANEKGYGDHAVFYLTHAS